MFLTPEQLGLNQQQIDEICEKLWKEESLINCGDCGVAPGERHLDGCDVVRCTVCGGQLLACDCKDGEPDIWTGLWPGTKECYEKKLICFDTCLDLNRWCFDYNRWISTRENKE